MSESAATRLANLWNDVDADALDEAGLLLYRSNLLGADLRITNFGGGNTSAKIAERDPLSKAVVDVLWVKGSGGDLGSMKRDGFATLYLDKLLGLESLYRGLDHEDEMVALFNHCTFNLNPRAASIDTPLHAFAPHKHVDHVHADAVIAIAASQDAERLTREIFAGEIGFLPWQRPGFDLGLKLGAMAAKNPGYVGWCSAATGSSPGGRPPRPATPPRYASSTRRAPGSPPTRSAPHSAARASPRSNRRGGARSRRGSCRSFAARSRPPSARSAISPTRRKCWNSSIRRRSRICAARHSCPDHFPRKIRPLTLPYDPRSDNLEAVANSLDEALEAYRRDYAGYYERCKHFDLPAMRDPNPVIYLLPGVGMMSFAKDKPTARIASEFYVNAINVMRGASGVGAYVGLPEQEAFDIEYWLLEEAKLQRLPKPKSLAGRVAYITGGAGGIGGATAMRLLGEGACVVLADIDAKSLETRVAAMQKSFGRDSAVGVVLDVTDEAAVAASFRDATLAFGGLDIVVSNAGIASAAPVEDTSLALWRKNMDILATGYFLVAREAFRLMLRQKRGGSIVFIASKNGLAASPGASAYCAAKATEIHLARCLALEGAPHGIRVNTINPDAVLRGSRIWEGEWREQRAASNKVSVDQLEDVYRQRSLLKLSVFPEDVAEGVYFFASDLAAKSTGNIINIDAGNAQSFTR